VNSDNFTNWITIGAIIMIVLSLLFFGFSGSCCCTDRKDTGTTALTKKTGGLRYGWGYSPSKHNFSFGLGVGGINFH